MGKLALQNGDQKTAADALAQAIQAAPDSYFAARARDIVTNLTPFAAPKGVQFEFDDAAQIAQAEDWLRKTYDIDAKRLAGDACAANCKPIRVWCAGANCGTSPSSTEAVAEFDDLVDANKENALASYQLAIYFQSIGAYKDSVVAASYVIRNANVGTLDAPPYIARLRYPGLLSRSGAGRQRDAIRSIRCCCCRCCGWRACSIPMRRAALGEKGLMQVTSSAALRIAAQLNWPNYQHSDLYRPYAGIEFGAYYLAEQLERFNGSVPAALVAYEAGAGRAQSWLDLSGGDPDQFMAAVDLDSARQYVQNVYSY